ncbi:hypothetical protein GCM10009021_19230 [Halarchaeum nitratireducens]|uniref:Uncharacterized protein n=1 Tax=Halarchaeum nitratireducens TaxID=489913 RepID=A0A830GCK6_9EURY|nr:hypothetical protein GCM10009021_19230 [Halarchaeum nitratireducens]
MLLNTHASGPFSTFGREQKDAGGPSRPRGEREYDDAGNEGGEERDGREERSLPRPLAPPRRRVPIHPPGDVVDGDGDDEEGEIAVQILRGERLGEERVEASVRLSQRTYRARPQGASGPRADQREARSAFGRAFASAEGAQQKVV